MTEHFETQKFKRQNSDIDLLDEESSGDESTSIDEYLEVPTSKERSILPGESAISKGSVRTEDVQITKAKMRAGIVVDRRRNSKSRDLHRRKTLDEFLCQGVADSSAEGALNSSKHEEKPTPQMHSPPPPQQSLHPGVPLSSTSSASPNNFSIEMDAGLRNMLAYEEANFKDLVALYEVSKQVMNTFGKHSSGDIFETLKELHEVQAQVLALLTNICKSKAPNFEDLLSKLFERQKILLKYTQLVTPRLQTFSSKLQSKASATYQRYIELSKKPTEWISQTNERIEGLKTYLDSQDPNYGILSVAQNELLDTSGDLISYKKVKEPLKYSVLVELRNSPNGERKLMSVFLFDNALVCARQRVIVLRRHFNQDSDSETASISTKERSNYTVTAKSISRYELKWFVPLDQIETLDTKGIAFDEENLRERLQNIEILKNKILKVQMELHEDLNKLDTKSKRQKLKIPKIHRLRSELYHLQGELVLQAPRLPLFINTTNGERYCLLMSSEKERFDWEAAISQAKSNCVAPSLIVKRNTTIRPSPNLFREPLRTSRGGRTSTECDTSSSNETMRSELVYIINHCKSVTPLNKLGNIILSRNALSGILEVRVIEATGLTNSGPCYVAIEVDSYGQFELVAKTKSIRDTTNPRWDQSFMVELETSQTICFSLYQDLVVIGQLELPLETDQMEQTKDTHLMKTNSAVPSTISLTVSISCIERSTTKLRMDSKKPSGVFGIPLAEVLKRDQEDCDRLQSHMDKSYAKLQVPVLVTSCVEEIERRGLQEEGIYRVSGTLTTISYLQSLFDQDTTLAIKQIGDFDIHVISGILKLFFRDLPESIIPPHAFTELAKATGIEDDVTRMKEFERILKTIPPVNLDTLRFLTDHLLKVCRYESENKMNLGNLSLIWSMNLLKPENAPSLSLSSPPPATMSPEALVAMTSDLRSVQSATSNSMLQTRVIGTIFKGYANGQLSLKSS